MSSNGDGCDSVYFDCSQHPSGSTFKQWKVAPESHVVPGTVLLTFEDAASGELGRYKAARVGMVSTIATLLPDQPLTKDTLLLTFRNCEHPVVMKDMCAECGEDLRKTHGMPGERHGTSGAKVAMIHSVPELQVTPQIARLHGKADEDNLLKQRKLVLLVDLDQTLIHTTNDTIPTDIPDVYHYQLYGAASPWYHTRLRPHTRAFLAAVAHKYELHICTFGQRLYAHSIARILDKEKKGFFGHRILSRDECFDPQLKTANLRALFPHGDHMACIIDDRDDVWQCAQNLIRVKPYRFFKHTGDINAPPVSAKSAAAEEKPPEIEPATSTSTDEPSEDASEPSTPGAKPAEDSPVTNDLANGNAQHEADDDDYLMYLEEILGRIHYAFYQLYDKSVAAGADRKLPDLKSVVPYVKRKVLQDVRIVLSGVVPMNVPPETTTVYRTAIAFGAIIQEKIVTKAQSKKQFTTHLLCAKAGTSKWKEATGLSGAVHVVQPAWLWTCAERWERVSEALFRVAPHQQLTAPSGAGQTGTVSKALSEDAEKELILVAEDDNRGDGEDDKTAAAGGDMQCFSKAMMRQMSAEVDDAVSDADDDAEDAIEKTADSDAESSTSGESLSADVPKGWSKKRCRKSEDGDVEADIEAKKGRLDLEDDSKDSEEDEDREEEGDDDNDDSDSQQMADALEKELS